MRQVEQRLTARRKKPERRVAKERRQKNLDVGNNELRQGVRHRNGERRQSSDRRSIS